MSWNAVITKRQTNQAERDHLGELQRLITELDGRGGAGGAQKAELRRLVEELIRDVESNEERNSAATRKLAESLLVSLEGTIDDVLDVEAHVAAFTQRRESLTAMSEYTKSQLRQKLADGAQQLATHNTAAQAEKAKYVTANADLQRQRDAAKEAHRLFLANFALTI